MKKESEWQGEPGARGRGTGAERAALGLGLCARRCAARRVHERACAQAPAASGQQAGLAARLRRRHHPSWGTRQMEGKFILCSGCGGSLRADMPLSPLTCPCDSFCPLYNCPCGVLAKLGEVNLG